MRSIAIAHDRGVVDVGIMRIGVLERPAARPQIGAARDPVAAHIEHLQRHQPIEAALDLRHGALAAGFQERMRGKPGVPDRRHARLAIGLVVVQRRAASRSICAQWRVADRSSEYPSASYIITLLAMAGKIAPSPSSPLSRSPTQATAWSIARCRVSFGKNGSAARSTLSTARKNQNHDAFCCGAFGVGPSISGGSRNSSSIRTPFALRARGFFAISTRSGTITVRLQYEILSRWNGNHFGNSMISTGITGTARHGTMP